MLYDTVRTTKHGGIDFLNLTDGSSNSFDIDMHAGAITGKTGVCVDLDSSMNEGCNEETVAKIKDGVVGCMDAFVSQFLCGLALEVNIHPPPQTPHPFTHSPTDPLVRAQVKHGDLSTVQTTGNLGYPRVLIKGSEDADGDGTAQGEMKCFDPVDCTQKCVYLERTSRHGAGAPPTCALYAHTLKLPFPTALC